MPIKLMTTTPAPGHLVQTCAICGAENRISFDRGAQKSRTGPFQLEVGMTLTVRVDAGPPTTVTFAEGDVLNFERAQARELAAKLNRDLAGVQAVDDAGGILLESATTGDGSRLEIVGGTACAALGFVADGDAHPGVSRLVLGVSAGPGGVRDPNVMPLRRCGDCGAIEHLVRTFDVAAPGLAGTHFAAHRRAVNALATFCRRSGWSHPHVAHEHAVEVVEPRDIDAGFSHRPCVLPRFVHANAHSRSSHNSGGAA
jgi:hypothetical protein